MMADRSARGRLPLRGADLVLMAMHDRWKRAGIGSNAMLGVFGRRVINAYHLPAVVPRPGIGVFFNRCGRRDNVVVSWAERAVEDEEARRILQDVSDGMGFRSAVVAKAERALLG